MKLMKPPWVVALLLVGLILTGAATVSAKKERENSFWVHSLAIQPESVPGGPPVNLERSHQYAWVKTSGGVYWFNVPFTTPEITENTQARLLRVYLLFATTAEVKVTRVEIRDGHHKVYDWDTSLQGDFRNIHDKEIIFDPTSEKNKLPPLSESPIMEEGLNIRFCVDFGTSGDVMIQKYFHFFGAGADFLREWE